MPDQSDTPGSGVVRNAPVTRRQALQRGGALAAGALAVPGVLAACGGGGTSSASGGSPRQGGTLKAALSTGSAPTFDPQNPLSPCDEARLRAAFDALGDYGPTMLTKPALGERFESDASLRVWKVHLRDAKFHNGKQLTADDVVYSFHRVFKIQGEGIAVIPFINPANVTKIDERTVQFELSEPVYDLLYYLSHHTLTIVPIGFTTRHPIGTGPFAFDSFNAATDTAYYRAFRDSWRVAGTAKPYVDQLQVIGIAEPTDRVAALLGGQIDAAESVDYAQIPQLKSAGAGILRTQSGAMPAFCMVVNQGPFRDVRVRQAFRLIANRPQMVNDAFSGYARLGNDLFAWYDPLYASDIPQREQDLEQAKFLLKAAGQSDLRIQLYTADIAPGVVSSATLFAQSAAAIGVNVGIVKQPASDYYSLGYGKEPFFMTSWDSHALDDQILECATSKSLYNETHWDYPSFDRLDAEGRATVNLVRRKEIFHELQEELWERGGYIVQSYRDYVDGIGSNVHGFIPSYFRALGWYGFEEPWLA